MKYAMLVTIILGVIALYALARMCHNPDRTYQDSPRDRPNPDLLPGVTHGTLEYPLPRTGQTMIVRGTQCNRIDAWHDRLEQQRLDRAKAGG